MPRFLCYCPDYVDALERRLAVRPTHLVGAKKDWDNGVQVAGSPFLPQKGSEQAKRDLPEGTPNLTGSFMIYVMDNEEQVWERIKSDPYWTSNVWDKEKMAVWPLLN